MFYQQQPRADVKVMITAQNIQKSGTCEVLFYLQNHTPLGAICVASALNLEAAATEFFLFDTLCWGHYQELSITIENPGLEPDAALF